jgi:hypothetical protein
LLAVGSGQHDPGPDDLRVAAKFLWPLTRPHAAGRLAYPASSTPLLLAPCGLADLVDGGVTTLPRAGPRSRSCRPPPSVHSGCRAVVESRHRRSLRPLSPVSGDSLSCGLVCSRQACLLTFASSWSFSALGASS